jgi:hypothetical protein
VEAARAIGRGSRRNRLRSRSRPLAGEAAHPIGADSRSGCSERCAEPGGAHRAVACAGPRMGRGCAQEICAISRSVLSLG